MTECCGVREVRGLALGPIGDDDAAEFTLCNQPPGRELEVTARSCFAIRRRDGICCCYPSAAFRLKWAGQRFRGASMGYATRRARHTFPHKS